MDWAGTAVDFGCFAPVNTFIIDRYNCRYFLDDKA